MAREPAATWALRRTAFDLLAAGDAAAAVSAFQRVLRADAADAAAWEGLAAAYQSLGRFTAALKVGKSVAAASCLCRRIGRRASLHSNHDQSRG